MLSHIYIYIYGNGLLVKSELSCFQVRSWKDTHLCVSKMSDLFVEVNFLLFFLSVFCRRHCTNMVLTSRRNMQLNSHLRCGLHTPSQYKVQVEVYYLTALIAHLFSLQLEVSENTVEATVEATVEGVLMCKELEASLQEDQNQAEVLLKKKMVTFLAPLIPTT